MLHVFFFFNEIGRYFFWSIKFFCSILTNFLFFHILKLWKNQVPYSFQRYSVFLLREIKAIEELKMFNSV